jgi:hypothetical protein
VKFNATPLLLTRTGCGAGCVEPISYLKEREGGFTTSETSGLTLSGGPLIWKVRVLDLTTSLRSPKLTCSTTIVALPWVVKRPAGTFALNSVGLTKLLESRDSFQRTVDSFTKPVPEG